jgi:hypothetical protein
MFLIDACGWELLHVLLTGMRAVLGSLTTIGIAPAQGLLHIAGTSCCLLLSLCCQCCQCQSLMMKLPTALLKLALFVLPSLLMICCWLRETV